MFSQKLPNKRVGPNKGMQVGIFQYLLSKKLCKWQLFPKINKHVGPNKAMQVGKNPKKE